MKFLSKLNVKCLAGNGGHGVVAWRRESNLEFGGPHGGDGGNGGSVLVQGDPNLNTLLHLSGKKLFKAKGGQNGSNGGCFGRGGTDCIISVPFGTVVSDYEDRVIYEVFSDRAFVLARGGKGGKGNLSFKSGINPAPTLFERGDKGEVKEINFDLRFIADVGLLGLPNAGKSSFLNLISNSKSIVDDYPFTTINPVLGLVKRGEETLTFIDIPGLIEGASKGKGLGHEFLKHVTRCTALLHMIDVSDPEPWESYQLIEREVKGYEKEITGKRFVMLNKIDLLDSKELEEINERFLKETKISPYNVSVDDNLGVEEIIREIFFQVKKKDWTKLKDVESGVLLISEPDTTISVTRNHEIWYVECEPMKYWIWKIPPITTDNRLRLENKIIGVGIIAELYSSGARTGDKVQIYGWNFDFIEP